MQPTPTSPEYDFDTTEPKMNRTVAIVGLGVLVVMAASLLVLRSSLKSDSSPDQSGMTDDWQSSFQHLHDAMLLRLNGIGERLDKLEADAQFGVRNTLDPPSIDLQTDLPAPRNANEPEPLPAPAPAHVSVPE